MNTCETTPTAEGQNAMLALLQRLVKATNVVKTTEPLDPKFDIDSELIDSVSGTDETMILDEGAKINDGRKQVVNSGDVKGDVVNGSGVNGGGIDGGSVKGDGVNGGKSNGDGVNSKGAFEHTLNGGVKNGGGINFNRGNGGVVNGGGVNGGVSNSGTSNSGGDNVNGTYDQFMSGGVNGDRVNGGGVNGGSVNGGGVNSGGVNGGGVNGGGVNGGGVNGGISNGGTASNGGGVNVNGTFDQYMNGGVNGGGLNGDRVNGDRVNGGGVNGGGVNGISSNGVGNNGGGVNGGGVNGGGFNGGSVNGGGVNGCTSNGGGNNGSGNNGSGVNGGGVNGGGINFDSVNGGGVNGGGVNGGGVNVGGVNGCTSNGGGNNGSRVNGGGVNSGGINFVSVNSGGVNGGGFNGGGINGGGVNGISSNGGGHNGGGVNGGGVNGGGFNGGGINFDSVNGGGCNGGGVNGGGVNGGGVNGCTSNGGGNNGSGVNGGGINGGDINFDSVNGGGVNGGGVNVDSVNGGDVNGGGVNGGGVNGGGFNGFTSNSGGNNGSGVNGGGVNGGGINFDSVNGGGVNRGGFNGGGVNGGGVNGGGVDGCTSNGGGNNGSGVNGGGVNGGGVKGGGINFDSVNGCGVNGGGVNGDTSNGGTTSNGGGVNGGGINFDSVNGGGVNRGGFNGGGANGGGVNGGGVDGCTSNGGGNNGGGVNGGGVNGDAVNGVSDGEHGGNIGAHNGIAWPMQRVMDAFLVMKDAVLNLKRAVDEVEVPPTKPSAEVGETPSNAKKQRVENLPIMPVVTLSPNHSMRPSKLPPTASRDLKVTPTTTSFLPRCVTTMEERSGLLAYLATPLGSLFLQPTMSNQGLLIEVTKDESSRKAANSPCSLGPFSKERSTHLSEIHFILNPTESTYDELHQQGYIIRDAKYPHYTCSMKNLVQYALGFEREIPIYLYDNRLNHQNHFAIVINHDLERYTQQNIDWDAADSLLSAATPASVSGNRQLSRSFIDLAYTGNMCTSRQTGRASGVAEPRLKPQSRHPAVVPLFVAASNFARSQNPEWLDGQEQLFVDSQNDSRQPSFAANIDVRNLLEFGRLHQTTVALGLGVHWDKENSDLKTMSALIGLIILRHGERIGFNGTSRSSIDNVFAREERDVPMARQVGDMYEAVDPIRRNVSFRLTEGTRIEFFPGMDMIRNECNFDPGSFHQPFLYYILLLTDKFNLSFPETVAVQSAMEFIPNTALFFVAACKCVLATWSTAFQHDRDALGFELGYVLMKLMKYFHREFTSASSNGTTPEQYRRYAMYVCPEIPSWKDWSTRNHFKTVLLLFAHSCYSDIGSRKKMRTTQQHFLRLFILYMRNLGILGGAHSLYVASKLGLAPKWMWQFATVKGDSRYMKYFADLFYGKTSFRPVEVEKIMETLQVYFANRFGEEFTDSKIENILCKYYRIEGNHSDGLWCDLLAQSQNVFCFNGDVIQMLHRGTWSQLPGSTVIERWPYGSDLLTPVEIANTMELGQTMPSTPILAGYPLTNSLMYPVSRHMFEFEYQPASTIERTLKRRGDVIISQHRREHRNERRGF